MNNSLRTANVTNELSNIINMQKRNKVYGFTGFEGNNVAERTADFLNNFLSFTEDEYVKDTSDSTSILYRLNDRRVFTGMNEDNVAYSSYEGYMHQIEDDDAKYRLWQQADLASNLREDILSLIHI